MNSLVQKLVVLIVGVGLVLLVPLVAMQFSDEVDWSLADFATAGALLFGAGLAYVLLARHAPSRRLAVGAAVLVLLGLVWVELAVGVFGTPLGGS